MASPRVLILHGLGHDRPRDHWLWWLAEELRRTGIPVQYPQFAMPEEPVLEDWVRLASAELDQLNADPEADRVVVAHSLGTVLWRHLAARGLASADRVLLVSPPLLSRLVDRIEPGWHEPIDELAAVAAVPATVVLRDTDPYRPVPASDYTAGWDATIHVLQGDGHLNPDDGHGPFPPALGWVHTGTFTPA